MKLPNPELTLMLLPCLGLLGLGLWLKPAPQAPPPAPPVLALEPTDESQANISIRQFEDSFEGEPWRSDRVTISDRVTTIDSTLNLMRPSTSASVHWCYNCRIEGTLDNSPHIFYSSGGHDPYNCRRSLRPFVSQDSAALKPPSGGLRQMFLLRRFPPHTTGLLYIVEAVALQGIPSPAQEMSRHDLLQVSGSPRRLGYATGSVPLFAF